jgi:diguanylate cyclase (GGDEF)-like protein
MVDAKQAIQRSSENLRQHYEDFERRRQFHLLYFFNGIAGFFLLAFGCNALFKQRYSLAGVVFFLLAIAVANILLLKFTGKQRFARIGFTVGIMVLFIYHLMSGGVNNTGPLWCYPGLAATFFLQGARRGLPIIAIFFAVAMIAFYIPLPGIEIADYSNDFKVRFLATSFALATFVGVHEYARARNQEELYRVSDKLDQLSKIDQLTDLPNRRYMVDRLEAENSRFARHSRPYSILYGDIDNFKAVNDQYGHQTGDHALKAIAQKIRAELRQHDEASRWGGEEFLIMLPETDHDMAKEVAEKLRSAISSIEFNHGNAQLRLTMSFGVHTVDKISNIDEFINTADKKLYVAKHNGKDQVVAELKA